MGLPSIPDISFPLNLGDIIKQIKKDNIAGAYEKMFDTAQRLASQETLDYMQHQGQKGMEDEINNMNTKNKLDIFSKTYKYRNARVAYHLDNMMQILRAKLEADDKKE